MGGKSEDLEQLRERRGQAPAAVAGLPPGLLAAVQELYDRGCSRQAYDLGQAAIPLEHWRGPDASILAGRILMNLGASRSAFRHHIRAYRAEPEGIRNQAYYLETFLSLRSPIYAWGQFRQFEKAALLRQNGAAQAEGWEYLFTLGARLCGMFQDFEQAEKRLALAGRHGSEMPWLLVETAGLLAARERPEEAIEKAREALRLRPWYRPAVHMLAQLLHAGKAEEEARNLLSEAAGRIESTALLSQWLILLLDLEQYGEALEVIDRVIALSPVLEQTQRNWLAAQQCRAHCALGNYAQAAVAAGRLKDEYHAGLAGRLQGREVPGRRVQLEVPFIQQFRLTCVPATLTMLRHFWKMPAEHVELTEALCYDGTPSHRARRWAEENGMLAREFTLDWDSAVALLERGIPVAVYTTDATSAHIRIIAGFDELRRTFIIRDPSHPQIQELIAEPFLEEYAASGPVGLVLLPGSETSRMAGLEFADNRLYDRLRKVQEALEGHHRGEAEAEWRRMEEESSGHRVTLTAGRAIHSYDTNLPALREILEQLLGQYPQDGNLLLAKLGCLRETGRREERLEFLRSIRRHRQADPVFRQQLAQELMVDARQRPLAERELKQALRVQRLHGMAHGTLANLFWDERRFDEARELYRLAACADDKKEPPAQAYFATAMAGAESAEAVAFLAERVRRSHGKSAAPFLTWFQALRQLGRVGEAEEHLRDAVRLQPNSGELWLAAADFHARESDFEKADLCLRLAAGRVPPQEWLKARAEWCRFRTDLRDALDLWRQVLETEPLALTVHRLVAWVLAESEGLEAALSHLEAAGARFPHHYRLHRLRCEWARKAGPEARLPVVRQLVETHPADAWARREMALALTEAARWEEALVEAEEGMRLAPQDPESAATRAFVLMAGGRLAEARADYREAIQLSVDHGPAIVGLVNSGTTVAQRRDWLAFVEQELVRQSVQGEGLRAYREVARLNLDPPVLLESLRRALQERPDLVAAWSAVVGQLAEMLELDEALNLARQAAERFPLVEQTWLDLALIQRLRWDEPAEREALVQAKRVNPTGSVAARRLAQLAERQGDMARAREEFTEACSRSPLDAVSHGYLALLFWREGQRAEALDRLRHAVRLEPGFVWGWQRLSQWAKESGQPQLAEELARTMVQQRPGEIHSLLVLARIQAGGQRREEGLATVDRALERFPRNPEAHELRAEILAELGRREEAEAACEPKIFGAAPPANLQVLRARLEGRRGNRSAAIQRMKAVLEENPGLVAAWQYLAEWHWAQEQFEEALAAVSNVPRLEPLNPVPLGYRASLKLQRNDQEGARADLELALKLDPAYEFAAINLFKLQLTARDLEAARRTLDCLQRFAPRETALAREIEWRARSLQSFGARPAAADAQQLANAAMAPALPQFRELCLLPAGSAENLDLAVRSLLAAGQVQQVDQVLEEVLPDPQCHPAVGRWWMARRRDQGKWLIPKKIRQLCPVRPAVRAAVIWQIEALGRFPESAVHLTARGQLMQDLISRAGPRGRGWLLAMLAWRHRDWLPADQDGWGAMGYALVTLRRFRAAARWLRDWRSREHVPMWMLFNLVLALRELKRWPEVREVLEFAVSLPGQDHTFPRLRLLLALELALAGRTAEADAHFRELPGGNWSGASELQFQCVRGLLALQGAAPEERKAVCQSETARLKSLLPKCGRTSQDPDYCRSRAKMETDAGDRWAWLFAWLGV